MIHIANAQLWVHDQDEALAFYTQKLGMEVRADVTLPEMGNFRWLAVGPPGQEDFSIVLMAIPGPPVMDAETKEQVETLMWRLYVEYESALQMTEQFNVVHEIETRGHHQATAAMSLADPHGERVHLGVVPLEEAVADNFSLIPVQQTVVALPVQHFEEFGIRNVR